MNPDTTTDADVTVEVAAARERRIVESFMLESSQRGDEPTQRNGNNGNATDERTQEASRSRYHSYIPYHCMKVPLSLSSERERKREEKKECIKIIVSL